MKKILTLVAALLITAACGAPPTNREIDTNRNSGSAPPTTPAMTEADAIAKEKAIWDTIKQKDFDGFAAMLADDELEVMPEGVMDKAGSIGAVKDFEPSEVNFSDWKFLSVDKNAFVISYTVAVKGKYQGKEFPMESSRSSSAWVNRNNKWVAIYHQECPLKTAAPPPAKPTPAPKAAPSPAVKPSTASLGPDAIANEKAVWELFKSKSYDAFSELLAPDFVEIEPDGVYDKAGTVKGVSMMDAVKADLSDWKATKIDDDAALVTYTVKNVGGEPAGERHSTIWVARDGKWMGLFHHGGTPVRKPASPPPPPKATPSARPAASPKPTASPR